MPLLVKGARFIDPAEGVDGAFDLLIEDGRVARMDRDIPPGEGVEVLDASGLVAAPGFIDMHVHLREPGEEYKEDIESGTRAAAAGGFTAVACMANTDPVNDTSSITERILKRAREAAACRSIRSGRSRPGSRGSGSPRWPTRGRRAASLSRTTGCPSGRPSSCARPLSTPACWGRLSLTTPRT